MHQRHAPFDSMPGCLQEESSPSSITCSSTSKWKFDVFLSFAGKDTRLNFTDHLYEAFIRRGIRGFRDDKGIRRGEVIKQQLIEAIKESLCAVVVLSQNYANSTWCLDELMEILESQEKFGRKVFPVFYGVDPSDVRYQRKSFGEALAKHEKRFKKSKDNKVQKWREALSQVSNLSGWDTRSRHEAEVIRDIVEAVWNTLCSDLPSYDDDLVGIESRMIEINSLEFCREFDISVVFERISGQFEMSCFLANVREISERKGLVGLQNYILSHLSRRQETCSEISGWWCMYRLFQNKKVLLVLDDVNHVSQLENLANPRWLGVGSRVIITTRNLHLLTSQGVHGIYEVKPMKKDESLELFSKKAFKKDHPEYGYFVLSETVVKYTGGLPLALYVLGSFLCGRSLLEWEETLERMKQIPDNDIFQILKISYLELNDEEKTIFLDIACLFNSWKRDEAAQILKNCDLHPTIGINILIEKKTLDGETILEVHDLLQELARSIVFQESLGHAHRRSRLWNLEDINEVLKNDKGSEAIQAIALPGNLDGQIEVHLEAFLKMCNLRLLIISSKLKFPNGLKCFSSALKVIRWRSYPLETLPIGIELDKLVDIQMPFSKLKVWNGMQLMKKLKFIDLSDSKDLVETPDFSEIPNLEKLNLEGCSSLIAVHHSLGELKKLLEVNLSCCTSLEILPKKLEMNSLTKLDISWCKKLSVLPEFGECMKNLTMLDTRKTAITRLPESLGFLTGLRDFNLRGPRKLALEMSSLNPTSLTMLDLSHCGISDESIPEDLSGLSSLITLHLEGNKFSHLPIGCFSNMLQLLHLYLSSCPKLKSMPKLPPRLIHLYATNCSSMEPLSLDGMWNLVSSLDHEYCHRTNYEKRVLQPIQARYVPEAEFLAIMTASEITSWFPNMSGLIRRGNNDEYKSGSSLEYEFVVDIPPYYPASKWCRLAVCLQITGQSTYDKIVISWSCQAHEEYYVSKEWENEISLVYANKTRLCLILLDFNETTTCWKHLRGKNNFLLHIKLSVSCEYSQNLRLECAWRALCKEEMHERGNTTYKLTTQVEYNSCPDYRIELQPPGPGSSRGGTHGGNTVSSSSNYDNSRRQNQGRRNPILSWWKQLFSTNIHHDQNNN